MNAPPDFRLLTLSDVEPAAQVIAQAFEHDPLIAFMLLREASRLKTLVRFFGFYGEVNIPNGRGYGVGDPLQGVAYRQAPGQGDVSVSVKSIGKLLPLLFTQYPAGYRRASSATGVLPQIEALHRKHAGGPHYYLDNLGVLPSAQGKGYSSTLIRPILARADEERAMVYTDAVTRSNVAFYEHFGFECVEEHPVAGTDLTIFAPRRPVQ